MEVFVPWNTSIGRGINFEQGRTVCLTEEIKRWNSFRYVSLQNFAVRKLRSLLFSIFLVNFM